MSYCSTVKTSLLLLLLLVSSPEVQGQTAQLRSVDCNRINTPLGLNLFANISGANQYKFKVKNLELGLTDSIVKPARSFNLDEIPTISRYNCNYEVSVSMDQGVGYGDYGTICNPSSVANITKLRNSDCGKHFTYLYTTVYASQTSADSWDFQIRKAGSISMIEDVFGMSSRAFNLSMASIAFQQFNQEYEIRVRTTQGTILQPWGDWCSIYTPAVIAKLRNSDCGRHISQSVNPFTFPLYANISFANSWDFQIRNIQDSNYVEDIFGLPTRKFQLLMAGNLFQLYNREYEIRVRTDQSGILQPWGEWCSVFTPFNLSKPQFPDLTSVSSAGRTIHNSYANSNLHILNNIGETITLTYTLYPGPGNGNPQTGSKILNQGFEQPSKWSVSKAPPKQPDDKSANINTFENDIQLFPNPYSDKLIVSLESDPIQSLKLDVFNTQGAQIESISIDKQRLEMNLDYLSPGTYHFQFYDVNNVLLETKKVIKAY
jgi:hypothetical protein